MEGIKRITNFQYPYEYGAYIKDLFLKAIPGPKTYLEALWITKTLTQLAAEWQENVFEELLLDSAVHADLDETYCKNVKPLGQ